MPNARRRRGVTLLEVLISIFVVAVGLLGIAALIPLGSFSVTETAKADRSAALGRSAQHEVRVRRMLERWRDDGAVRWYVAKHVCPLDDVTVVPIPALQFRQTFLIGQPFAIDPLFATEATISMTTECFECFPYKQTGDDFVLGDPNLARLQLDIFEGGPPDSQQLAVLNRIFRWQDDLIFDINEDDPDRRPRQSCLWGDATVTTVAAYPNSDPPPGNPLHAQANDNFTWMLTAVPDPSELPITSDIGVLTAHRQKTYEVSIVTFYKRDFSCNAAAEPPSERFVGIGFQGTGIGGGDARLMVLANPPDAIDGKTREEATEYLKVKENEWIMVTGFVREPRLDPITMNLNRRIAKWYRVIRVDDEIESYTSGDGTNYYIRNVTLAGPDWDNSASPTVISGTARATIIDGAIGVYTTTVTLE